MKITKLLLVMLFSIAVAACGGGGGGQSSTPTNTVNAVINQSGGQATLNNGTTVTFDSNLVKDGTAVTISTLPPDASTSTEISSLSSLVRITLPIDALITSGSSPDTGITVSIPSSGVVAGVTTSGVMSTVGQAYKFIQAKLTAGTASVIFYGKVAVGATSIAAKLSQAQMVNFYKSVGTAAQNFLTVDILVNLVQPNVPTAGTLFKIQYIGSGVNFSTYSDADYSFVDSLPNSGLTLGKIPLVLVHGIQIAGCEGNADAYKSTWEKFIMFFFSSQGQALRSKYQLYTFSYKTFDHIEDNGLLLANDLKVIFGNVPTVIVAHSMGGLVTRSAIVQHAGIGAQIGGVITLGTPHHGTKVVDGVAGYVNKHLCVLATSSPGADDLKWDNFDDPSKVCGNSFLCGTAISPHVNSSGITSIGVNTADTASNYAKYIPYAGVWDPLLSCPTTSPMDLLMCGGAIELKKVGYSSDGMVPEASARFTDFIGGQYLDKLQWSAKPRTYQGIHHSSIHDDLKIFTQYPNVTVGGLVQDLLDFYVTLFPPVAAPTVTLTATPTSIASGATSTINWSSTNSTSCTSSGGGGTGTAGSFTTPPLTTTTTYTVTCTGAGGTASQSATVTVAGALPTSKLNDTGITASQCYQAGRDVLVACNSAGAIALNNAQDGMVGRDANPATNSNIDGKLGFSFTSVPASGSDTGGCVQDNVTGLMWEVKTTDGGLRDWTKTYTNYSATYNPSNLYSTATDASGFVVAVNAANLCGYSDWRLPTADELQSIMDYSVSVYGPGPMVDAAWFPNSQGDTFSSSHYWSASPWIGLTITTLGSLDWVAGQGSVYVNSRASPYHVRLVRAGQSPASPHYTVSANGQEVTDNQTKLIWRRCAEGMNWDGITCASVASYITHEAALQLASTQASSTGIAWRLPNIKELASIAGRTLSNPAIDSTAFPATPANCFWSATPMVGLSNIVWGIYFYDGSVGSCSVGGRGGGAYVRLVRDGP